MALEVREHIELHGDDSLTAMIVGTRYKAYVVANLAFNDRPQASAEHYGIPLANVYGAMAFYDQNERAIEDAIRQARELGQQLGARSAQAALEELRARKNTP